VSKIITLTADNFDDILSEDGILLVDFWAAWCGPCKMFSPILDQIAEENDDITIGKVNIDEESELAESFDIMSIPTLLVFKDGELCNKSIGAIGKASVLELVNECKSQENNDLMV
jgi:thioredoxin 1